MEECKLWKEIEGYSRYRVSPDGEVLDTKTNRLVAKQLTGKPQYYYVNVHRDEGGRKLERVHRFVAMAYVDGRSEDFNIVDHIDRDKLNNHFTNLRWVNLSGNARNRGENLYVFGTMLKDYSQQYDNPEAAYSYISACIRQGMSDEEAVTKYQENLDYGLKRVVVDWKGVETYLVDLCCVYNKDYFEVNARLRKGWDIWNAIHNIYPEYPYSLEVPCELATGHWFPSKKYLGQYFKNEGDNLRDLAVNGATYQELQSYDKLDHVRKTVRGVTGTIKELCQHFGVSESAVSTNMTRNKVSLEEALFAPRRRVKKLSINGESHSPKYWYEHFNLNPKSVNNWKSRNNSSFKETLEHFGIDTSGMIFSEI